MILPSVNLPSTHSSFNGLLFDIFFLAGIRLHFTACLARGRLACVLRTLLEAFVEWLMEVAASSICI